MKVGGHAILLSEERSQFVLVDGVRTVWAKVVRFLATKGSHSQCLKMGRLLRSQGGIRGRVGLELGL